MVSSQPDSAATRADAAALFTAHWRPLVQLAGLLIGDREAAEDVVQDAFVAFQRNRGAPRDSDAAAAYLRATVVNRSRSVLRHRYVVARFGARRDVVPQHVEPATDYDNDEAMLAAVNRLPRRQREVLILRYWADLSHAEIAATLGIALGSVKAAASRGLAVLRSEFEETT